MGREVRRVPLYFDWPLNKVWPGFKSYYDFCETCESFLAWPGFEDYEERDCQHVRSDKCPHFEDVPDGPGWQVWENVSEGSPVTPVFATKGELVEHLVKHGADGIFGPMTEEAAVRFVDCGWAMTMGACGGRIYNGAEAAVACTKGEDDGTRRPT